MKARNSVDGSVGEVLHQEHQRTLVRTASGLEWWSDCNVALLPEVDEVVERLSALSAEQLTSLLQVMQQQS